MLNFGDVKNNKKVMLLMSGGVDSSVSAFLLKNLGYEVTGVTMQLYGDNSVESDAVKDAKNVANQLNIDHFTVDLSDEFSCKVIDPFVNEYLSGKTPNPCVLCNKFIKFGRMQQIADDMGFFYIATGHYAIIDYSESLGKFILKAADHKKDQSYVLYNLKQEQLKRVLFPIGKMSKEEIRRIAKENNILTSDKPESQDICFIKDGDYVRFIENYTDSNLPKGDFVDLNGNKLGEHQGIIKYTIGQRKGLGVEFGKPMYVVAINKDENTVVLGEENSQYKDELTANNLNFILFDYPERELEVTVKVRYKANLAKAMLIPAGDKKTIRVKFYEGQRAITPGQAIVFYDKDIVLGGGTIMK